KRDSRRPHEDGNCHNGNGYTNPHRDYSLSGCRSEAAGSSWLRQRYLAPHGLSPRRRSRWCRQTANAMAWRRRGHLPAGAMHVPDRQRRAVTVRARRRDLHWQVDALEPGLAEICVDLAWAEPTARAALARADAALEDDRVALDMDHPAGRLVDDVVDARLE